jgi:hypothetical protein
MKNMTLGAFAFASALALASTPGHALSNFFSFSCASGDVFCTAPGMVTGVIDGLVNTPNRQAFPGDPGSELVIPTINSAPAAFGLNTPVSLQPNTTMGSIFIDTETGVILQAFVDFPQFPLPNSGRS